MLDILNKSSTAHRTTHSAAPECRVCNRRRIRCDGTRPACRKCMSRGLECSGYGKTFKWICGAASKGPNRIIFPTAPTRYHSHQFAEASIQSSPVVPSYQKPTVLYGYKQLPSLLSSTSLPGMENLLLQHFVDVVSVQLAWCEGEPNPWRIIVLPLAMESLGPSSSLYSLLSVILGVAASNVASRLAEGDTQRDMYLRITDTLRAKALRFLSEDLRVLRGALQSGSPRPPQLLVQTVITSVLLLSYLEVHWPSSGMWHFHLRTAQNISNMMQFAATTDSINAFLSEELFSASTWALLTHYPPNEISGTLEPYGKCGAEQRVNGKSPFIAFVVVMRRVTQARRNTAIRRVERVKQLAIFCTILQNALFDLDKAYKMVLKEPNTVYSTNRHDFECVVSAYYHATQIYCHQALSTDVSKLDEGLSVCSDQSTLLRLRTNLLDSLLSLENPASLAQSQPWPLFVLATVSTQDPTAQSWIEMRMNYVMELYCELDRPRMLRFLKSFWGQAAYDNWIEYAQSWIQNHGNFLIL